MQAVLLLETILRVLSGEEPIVVYFLCILFVTVVLLYEFTKRLVATLLVAYDYLFAGWDSLFWQLQVCRMQEFQRVR